MKSGILWWFNGESRMISRAHWSHRLSSAGIACLGLVLLGFGALTPAQAQEGAHGDEQNTHYTIEDLGVVGANPNQPGQPFVISNSGWIGGGANVGSALHAVLWRGGEMLDDIGNSGLGGNSMAVGVNLWGHAVGEAEDTSSGLSTTEDFCGFQFMGYSLSPTPCVPFIWNNGKMTPLKTLGGVNGVANQINSFGAITGFAENTTKDPGCSSPQIYQFKPVVWFQNSIQPLPTGSDAEGVAFSINDLGQVVGTSGSCAPFNPIWLFNLTPVHALLWQNGVATDLGNLGGVLNNMAHDINNLGQVVGGSDLPSDQTSHAFLWAPATRKMKDLGTVVDKLDTDSYSVGLGINDKGQIVGVSANADFSIIRGFIRQNGRLVDLNSLVAGNTSLDLITACSINFKGEIIGIAVDPTGATHAYLATPTH
jgi:probable HAF family extracellular repeat protein